MGTQVSSAVGSSTNGGENLAQLAETEDGSRGVKDKRPRVRWLALLAVGAWSLTLVLGVGYGSWAQTMGDFACETFEGGSQYGELRWSALPPGPTCTFTAGVHGFDEVRGPYPATSIWLGVLAAVGPLSVALLQASRST